MTTATLIPAAEYLRVSTEHQEYSIANQSQIIREYAQEHGFCIVQTYLDPAVSGVLLRRRRGLTKLIQDVLQGEAPYRAVLVYDISRWGRFQDTDESAHYEFLCKSSGVPVHYCAETFPNDNALPHMVMKALKRAMAGEYVRELGTKVVLGQRRGATQGFRQGGEPGYGLRRQLLSANGSRKQLLRMGERKSIATDRVILVPGPAAEVRWVHEIYRLFTKECLTFSEIARELNRRKAKYLEGASWNMRAVQTILTHPKYVGCNVYGRFTQRLYTPPTPKPRSEWVIKPGAFQAIVDVALFEAAQKIIERKEKLRPSNRSDEELLQALRRILNRHGRITMGLLQRQRMIPSAYTYRRRFGALSKAYDLIGYRRYWRSGWLGVRRGVQNLRNDLMEEIVRRNPEQISIEKRIGRYRSRLVTREGRLISVSVCRPISSGSKTYWLLVSRKHECQLLTLVVRLNSTFDAFEDMYLIAPTQAAKIYYIKKDDECLKQGIKLTDLARLSEACSHLSRKVTFKADAGDQ